MNVTSAIVSYRYRDVTWATHKLPSALSH